MKQKSKMKIYKLIHNKIKVKNIVPIIINNNINLNTKNSFLKFKVNNYNLKFLAT